MSARWRDAGSRSPTYGLAAAFKKLQVRLLLTEGCSGWSVSESSNASASVSHLYSPLSLALVLAVALRCNPSYLLSLKALFSLNDLPSICCCYLVCNHVFTTAQLLLNENASLLPNAASIPEFIFNHRLVIVICKRARLQGVLGDVLVCKCR